MSFALSPSAGPTATLSTCGPPAKRSVSATTAIKANATVRKKKPEV
jgi:hypothetical protein